MKPSEVTEPGLYAVRNEKGEVLTLAEVGYRGNTNTLVVRLPHEDASWIPLQNWHIENTEWEHLKHLKPVPKRLEEGSVVLSRDEVDKLYAALSHAASDIWQTARVAEYNLTGNDPVFPEDQSSLPPETPKLIHREGLDESYRVHEEVKEALRLMAIKRGGGTTNRDFTSPKTS